MKIGFFAIGLANTARPEIIATLASDAERLGFATVWAPEHLLFVEKFASRYPYARGATLPISTDVPLLNPFVALSYAAARTRRIRLATGICLVPEYHPLLLAKLCASLDYLSGGRFALGIGIGWLREEFEALGIPWERRAARTREYVAAMRGVWGTEHDHQGEFVQYRGVISYPKPSGAGLPVLVGGQSPAALKRAAEYGDGWCGFNLTPEETAQAIGEIRRLRAERGRVGSFEFSVSPVDDATPDDLKRYRDAGVDELYLTPVFKHPLADAAAATALVEEVARRWVEPAARL